MYEVIGTKGIDGKIGTCGRHYCEQGHVSQAGVTTSK